MVDRHSILNYSLLKVTKKTKIRAEANPPWFAFLFVRHHPLERSWNLRAVRDKQTPPLHEIHSTEERAGLSPLPAWTSETAPTRVVACSLGTGMHLREPEQPCNKIEGRQGVAASYKLHSHAPPPQQAHFRPQGRSGTRASSLHQPAAALDGAGARASRRRFESPALCCGSLNVRSTLGTSRAQCHPPPAAHATPIPGPWPSGVRLSRSRSACLGSGSCSATSPRSRRSGSRRLGRLGPSSARGTRGLWPNLRLHPVSDAAVGTTNRSCRAVAWSPESHLLGNRGNPRSAGPRAAATG